MTEQQLVDQLIAQIRVGNADSYDDQYGGHITTDCPRCGKERHFSIRIVTGYFLCYSCGYKGRASNAISGRTMEWAGALRRLNGLVSPSHGTAGGGYVNTPDVKRGREGPGALFPVNVKPAWENDGPASKYLLRRGVTRDLQRRYLVAVDILGHRVWFPYWEEDGRVSFFMGRTIVKDLEPKTIEPPASDKPLYGLHVGLAPGSDVFVVEGVFDHFATPFSLAQFGSILTTGQIKQLKQLGRRVFLPYDPDAKDKARSQASLLRRAGIPACALAMEGTTLDPADLGEAIMRGLVVSVRERAASMRTLPHDLSVFIR